MQLLTSGKCNISAGQVMMTLGSFPFEEMSLRIMGFLQPCPGDDYSNCSCFSPSKVVVVCQEAKGMSAWDKGQFVSMQEDKCWMIFYQIEKKTTNYPDYIVLVNKKRNFKKSSLCNSNKDISCGS